MMNIFSLIKLNNLAFHYEDERHLAFLLGYQLDVNTYLRSKKFRYQGVIYRSLIFLKRLAKEVTFPSRNRKKTDFLVFASTNNQFRSLFSTVNSLQQFKKKVTIIYSSGVTCTESSHFGEVDRISFNLQEINLALLYFFLRGPKLYLKLLKQGNQTGINKYFDRFSIAYLYLPYFFNLLDHTQPRFVIVANDHNVENRCLKLAAEILKIKTVFLQHGSGSEFLPPLEFDYAFLDGMVSVNKYLECNKSINRTKRNLQTEHTTIFLSGLKKVVGSKKNSHVNRGIGLAINPYDQLSEVELMLNVFLEKGFTCIIRAHPAQDQQDMVRLNELVLLNENLFTSMFDEESVDSFLSRCSLLIAGNSSIHLEALIARVPSYYAEFGDSGLPTDYYKHLKEGLVDRFPKNFAEFSVDDLTRMTVLTTKSKKITQKFSESFGTQWEGKEGDLVAQTLLALTGFNSISNDYNLIKDNQGFKAVYQLKNQQ